MTKYSAELKERVIASWMTGSTLNYLAAEYKMPATTIQRWIKGRTRITGVIKPNDPDWKTIDELAEDWTRAQGLATLAILRKTQDDSWLDRQNAHDLGVLYGIIADKQLRLLAAFRPKEPVPAIGTVDPISDREGETLPS